MAESKNFKKNPRDYALELVEEGSISADKMLLAALNYMSFDDVRGMLEAEELDPDSLDDEEEDEDEEDEEDEEEEEDEK